MLKGDGGKDSEREVSIFLIYLSNYCERLFDSQELLDKAALGESVHTEIILPRGSSSEDHWYRPPDCFPCYHVREWQIQPSRPTKLLFYLPRKRLPILKDEEEEKKEKKSKREHLRAISHKFSVATFFSKPNPSGSLRSSSTETIVPSRTSRESGSLPQISEEIPCSTAHALSILTA